VLLIQVVKHLISAMGFGGSDDPRARGEFSGQIHDAKVIVYVKYRTFAFGMRSNRVTYEQRRHEDGTKQA
jgi:hypothetical protein